MSSSEENFDLDVSGSESDGYAPAPKKKAPAKKPVSKAAPKAAAKPKATKKTRVLLDKNDNADSDEDEEPMDEDPASGVAPLAEPSAPTNAKKKTASEMYTKVRAYMHLRHVHA